MSKSDNQQLLLEWVRDLGKNYPFFDMHVHPYEVLTGDVSFNPDPQIEGLFNKGMFRYHPPVLDNINPSQPMPDNQHGLLLAARLTYNHTGPKVLTDQIDLVGLSGALLLPVARTAGKAEEMLEVSQKMFEKEIRLFSGCALPIGIQPDKLADFFRFAHQRNGIRAIKFHHNLTGIDPLTKKGEELTNATLAAAGELNLPIVVHGGRSPGIEPIESREYGIISRLANVDWSISIAPVILAHAGCHGLTHAESIGAISVLNNLFEKHSNLMADTSNLEPPILQLVLEKISPTRLVFGSDALYVPIWKAWLRFLESLQLVSAHPDDDLIRIASINSIRCLSL
jgi:predicted TIM-barrel fold metal-dependent hydrolase